MKKKILVILPRVPYPLEKGDKLRAFHQIKELSRNWDIILCALNDQSIHPQAHEQLRPFCHQVHFFRINRLSIIVNILLNFFKKTPFQVAYFFHKGIKKKIHQIIQREQVEYVYCQLIRTAEYAWDVPARKTIDFQDCFSMGLKRRRDIAPWYLRPIFNMEFKRVLKYEQRTFEHFQGRTIISEPDRQQMGFERRNEIVIVPNGVNFNYFTPSPHTTSEAIVLFTGNMSYPPNIKAAEYLAKEIMPLVWQKMPQVKLVLAGASPSAKVRNLVADKVEVTGWVDDMRDWYAQCKVFIAPMQIGTGLQNKLLEAMAMKRPCITSSLANQSLGATSEKHILIGNSDEEYAFQILSLLNNPAQAETLAQEGYLFVKQNFDWEAMTGILEKEILGMPPKI